MALRPIHAIEILDFAAEANNSAYSSSDKFIEMRCFAVGTVQNRASWCNGCSRFVKLGSLNLPTYS